jgi:E3 ubiquitin-protein ligase RNF144
MQCVCGTSFCWLCGIEIEDGVFPRHFQWWNVDGCANMQMNNDLEPSQEARWLARFTTVIQIIIFGPITLVSTIVSMLFCPCCLVAMVDDISTAHSCSYAQFCDIFTNCLTGWGLFYMIVLVFIPVALMCGGLVVSTLIMLCPFYAVYR